jgi:hypothetical protein
MRLERRRAFLRRSQDRLWEDVFIDSCDEWAVPYIGDLVGTRMISALNARGRRVDVAKTVPQFPATFFGLTGMHMLHVTLGVVYLGIVALRRNFIPILLVFWLAAWLGTPSTSPFHYGAHVLLVAAIVCSVILWLKPKVYDSSDVEVAGLYWHFVDLVWMFIFPLVYLMSAKIL